MFVHDLNQFVIVQLLEETPAVQSPGKLCKDHGYSYEWVSGQEPRLTQNGKSIICKTDNFVPLVVPEFSTNSGSSSSSTTLPLWDQRHSWSLEAGLYQARLRIQFSCEVTNLPQGNLGRNL